MANFRIPSAMCSVRPPWSLQDGTLALFQTSVPGTICGASSRYPMLDWLELSKRHVEPEVDFLFLQCRNPGRGLSDADYATAAQTLGVEIAAIQAVAEVETSGQAFDENGRPRILFERHYFHRLTSGRYDRAHPDISNAKGGGYGKFSAQYGKLERAYKLDANAALESASWGRFQIMGKNHRAAGYASVKDFVFAMARSEADHLIAFTNFVAHDKRMLKALRNKQWATFASAYNGGGYKKNQYDTKLEEAYQRFDAAAKAAAAKAGGGLP